MNKGNLMVSSLNLFFLMQNIKMKCNFVFQVFFLTRSSFERNKTHLVASDSWHNL